MCTALARSTDIDDNKYETLLSNPPVEQNLIHSTFDNADDCHTTKTKADDKDATRTPAPATVSTTNTVFDGCNRLVEKIISSFETPPLLQELPSLEKFTSDNNGIIKKSEAASSSAEKEKANGNENEKENNFPIIDVSCFRKPVTSNDGENGNNVVKLPVIRRIIRFYIHKKPDENVPSPVEKIQEENLLSHPLVHSVEPKFHSMVMNQPSIILHKIPPTESNIHVFPLLTPLNVKHEHFENDGRTVAQGLYPLFHPVHSNINTQHLNCMTPSVEEHYNPAHVQSYALAKPKFPEIVNLANVQHVLPVPLYRIVFKEPLHAFGDFQIPSPHLHTMYANEAKVPVSQWHPLSTPTYSKQICYAGSNYGHYLPPGYVKKDTTFSTCR